MQCFNYAICFILFVVCVDSAKQPNFVFILTDDQDLLLDGLVPMPKTLKLVANEGVTFEHSYVHSPICCPSRSSTLTGKFLHNIHVTNNSISGNCSSLEWQNNHESKTIAPLLKLHKNYTTFYAGKYLNQYGSPEAGGLNHIPNGYDHWYGLKGNSKYYNYTLSVNGSPKHFADDYLTDVIKTFALEFLSQVKTDEPFFMMMAPPAAHAPFVPAKRHEKAFPDVKALRTPSFNYTPTGKHWLLQLSPLHLPENVTILDKIQRSRQQTLLAVDEMVEAVVHKLEQQNLLQDTYIIFTSDNGFHIGQFGQPWDKRQPYQTDVNVPLLVRGPGIPKKMLSTWPTSSVDIAPTILDFAGIPVPKDMDGVSFKSKLQTEGDRYLLVEYHGEANEITVDPICRFDNSTTVAECSLENWCKCQDSRNNTYTCLLHISPILQVKVCDFADEVEFGETYDLKNDPNELKNLYYSLSDGQRSGFQEVLNELKICSGYQCREFDNEI